MLMPKKDRVLIYEYLFKNGVCVARKDFHAAKHPDSDGPDPIFDDNVPGSKKLGSANLVRIPIMYDRMGICVLSLHSRGYVSEKFAWRHYYWTLTNEGITYLREFLHLPPEIVPSTLKRQQRPETARPLPGAARGERQGFDKDEQDRLEYRRTERRTDKVGEAGVGAGTMEFKGGFGGGSGFGGGFGGGFGRGKPPM
uniref:Plectin/S10 N-terminal domain-containing protein n=1 Tax=Romanomermis culicivorax TaxID=13658 RepID=A0A915L910_ROMCU